MSFRICHQFKYRERIYAIDAENLSATIINDNAASLSGRASTKCPESFLATFNQEAKCELLNDTTQEDSKSTANKSTLPVKSIALFVSQKCNMKCVYCYGGDGTYENQALMSKETAARSIDWLIEQSKAAKRLNIHLFGGEPLLNFDLVNFVVEYAREKERLTDKSFEFSVTTNGSLLDEEKIRFFQQQRIEIMVSFDGTKEAQDFQRPLTSGKGSYDVVASGIKRLLDVMPQSPSRATLYEKGNAFQVKAALHEIGFKRTAIGVASPPLGGRSRRDWSLGRNDFGILSLLEEETQTLLGLIRQRDEDAIMHFDSPILGRLQKFLRREKQLFPCGAGRTSVAVSVSGEAFLCHRFVGMKEFKVGDIFGEPQTDSFRNSPLDFVEGCRTCFAKYLCGGGCYHDNLGMTGSVYTPSEDICRITRHETELAAYLSCDLSEDDKQFLSQCCGLELFGMQDWF